ncbi:MAG TPA: hypothetical protein VJ203_10170 [Bacteroidales bacterium]|nr:hypothetical protein [Bacteroidales bacterium]
MRAFLKISVTSCLFLLSIPLLQAADTLKIHLTYKHKLNPSGQTTGYVTVNQKFYTPDNIYFREINYDEKTGQISDYTFYFYKNGRLFTGECYDGQDSLKHILKHEYDQNGNEILLTRLVLASGKLVPAERTVSRFDAGNRIILLKKYTGKKLTRSSKYSYNESELMIRDVTKYKGSAAEKIKGETLDYSYNADGKISQVTINGRDASNKVFSKLEEYSYNEKNLLAGIKCFNGESVPAGEKIFKYLNSGAQSLYQENDANGNIFLLLQYDYKKHYMERGTQVSSYENL